MATINIGGKLHSVATGNVVAGADEILDDTNYEDGGKKQSIVNAELAASISAETDRAILAENNRYTKEDTYSKEELDNLITTPEVEYVTVETYEELEVLTGAADTIYRVANYDGTDVVTNKYCEYAWDGEDFVLLDVKDYGIDDIPTENSENVVTSNGIYASIDSVRKDSLEEFLEERYIDTWPDVVSNGNITGLRINSSTGIIEVATTSSSAKSRYHLLVYEIKKGTIIRATAGVIEAFTSTASWTYGFLEELPTGTLSSVLVGEQLEHWKNIGVTYEKPLDVIIVAPYDGYLLRYYYNWSEETIGGIEQSRWDPSLNSIKVFVPGMEEFPVRDSIKPVTSDGIYHLAETKMNIITEDVTEYFSWTAGGSVADRENNTTKTVDSETGEITFTINTDQSGSRFGILATSLPAGTYKIEYDSNKEFLGGTFYTAKISQTSINYSEFIGDYTSITAAHTYRNGHYTLWITTTQERTFFIAYANQSQTPHSVGTTFVINNFIVTKVINNIREWGTRIEDSENSIRAIQNAAVKTNAVNTTTITLTPSASETYNLYKTGSGAQFILNTKRLCYFPQQIIVGGQTVTFKYTGLNYIDVYQLAEKEGIDLDSSPSEKYTVSEVMMSHLGFSKQGTDAFDNNCIEDSESPTGYIREVSFVTHPKCKRLAFVMGSTQNITQSTSNIVNNITEITLPIYDTTKLNFSVYAKQEELNSLKNRVNSNRIWTTENPSRTTYTYCEIKDTGVIDTNANNKKFRIVVYNDPLSAGDLIKFHGETDGTSRAQRWTFVENHPESKADLEELSPVNLFTPESTMEIAYDENNNPIHRTYDHLIEVPYDGIYLMYYYYADNWTQREISYSYNNSLQSKIESLSNNLSSTEEYIKQAKYVSSNNNNPALGLLHFSDIHGDDEAVNTILKAANSYSEYIDDVICTGDSVHYYADGTSSYPHGTTWWQGTELAKKALFVLGNHDSATTATTTYDQKEDSAAWDGKGKAWCFQNYFNPYISNWEVTMPEGYDDSSDPNYQACFWHKDYALGENGVRVIGLDCLHRFDGTIDPETGNIITAGVKWTTNEQELWLVSKLNETLDSTSDVYGYSIVICCHYPIDDFSGSNEEWDDSAHKFIYNHKTTGGRVIDYKTSSPVNFHWANTTSYTAELKFNMRNRTDNGYGEDKDFYWYDDNNKKQTNYKKGSVNNIANIIQNWMSRGGKFVAWLCGHTHVDYMWYSTNYPDILCVVIDQAGCLRGTNTGARIAGTNSRTCANYYSIDIANGLFKIVRIGYTYNRLLTSRKYFCYDYINRKVINEG